MKIHNLKSLPEHFEAVWVGDKNFEIRKNDRGFESGDFVILQEYGTKYQINSGDWSQMSPSPFDTNPTYSGRIIIAEIKLVSDFAQKDDYVVLGIAVHHKRHVVEGRYSADETKTDTPRYF